MLIRDITTEIVGKWRDDRMTGSYEKNYADKVSGSTVNRELNILSHVFTTARREWKWIEESPSKDVRRPKEAPHRDRLISEDEIERLCVALGYDGSPVTSKQGAVGAAFLFAIETGMRAGEICALTRANVHGAVAHLPRTKNGTKRDVPLSTRARQILDTLPDADTVFGLQSSVLDTLFRRARAVQDRRSQVSRHPP